VSADAYGRPTVIPAVFYKDPFAARDWLEKAFGFRRVMVITDDAGNLGHAEMEAGEGGLIMVGGEWAPHIASAASVGGKNTQNVHVHIVGSVDEHCAKARAAGARIVREPEDQVYGDRTYVAADPEDHTWSFAQ
jgi:uncharacterized glyoxalase superfamily protein PhnB